MTEKIEAFPKREKKKVVKSWVVFVITILSAALIVTSSLLFSEIFKQSYLFTGNIPLGTETIIRLDARGSFATAITYDGSNLPGTKVVQKIRVSLPLNSETVVMRAKIFASDEGGNVTNIVADTAEIWLLKDGYYYYNDVLEAGVTTTFTQKITLPTENDFFNPDKYYEIIVVVETLSYGGEVNFRKIWKNAPEEWLNMQNQ